MQKEVNRLIEKLDNGATLITLGEGTVFTGVARADGHDHPVGICFTNEQGHNIIPAGTVVIQIRNEKAIASYIMALVRLIETWEDDESSQLTAILEDLKRDLEPLLPQAK
jgi:hypothetical protein